MLSLLDYFWWGRCLTTQRSMFLVEPCRYSQVIIRSTISLLMQFINCTKTPQMKLRQTIAFPAKN
jgi:hypothetical protein